MALRFYDYPDADVVSEFFRRTGEQIDGLNQKMNDLLERARAQGQLDSIHFTEASTRIAALDSALQEADARITIIHEPFVDTKGLDSKALKLPAAQVATEYGILTLRRSGGDAVSPRYIRITGGNGWPGNTHQVYDTTGLYYARDGLHNSLLSLIDNNTDTWLEYERIHALPGVKYRATSFAEGISWLEFDWLPLWLELELELEDLQPLGAFAVSPFLSPLSGYRPASMSAIIDDGRGLKQSLSPIPVDDNLFIPHLPQEVRTIRLTFEQKTGVKTMIGLPSTPLPLAVAGVAYNSAGTVENPVYDAANPSESQESLLIDTYYSQPATETAPAVRYMIGLKEIRPIAYTYVEESEFASPAIAVAPGTGAIRVDGSYFVPALLQEERLVKWSISFDDGASWIEVAASDRDAEAYDLPREIRFSEYVPIFLRSKNTLYLSNRPESVRLKIELRRPTDLPLAEYLTPVVSSYTLVMEEEGL